MRPATSRLLGLPLLAIVAAGCAGGAVLPARFSNDWVDDQGASIGKVWDRLAGTALPRGVDVAIGVAGADELLGLPLEGGARWTFKHALDSRPIVTGAVVVVSGGGELVALEAKSGQVVWRRPTGGIPVLGAADDGLLTVVTLQRAGGIGSTLLAVSHDGSVVQQIETDKPLGAPAVVGRLAFVPWAGQYVSVVDLSTGNEEARVTLREQTTRAWIDGGALWFGQGAFIRFDARIREASRGQATRVSLPARELPGTPHVMTSGAEPLPSGANATDKVRLYAKPDGQGPGGALAGGRWYATYFRLAMGFGAGEGKLAWVHTHGADFLGGDAGAQGVTLCDAQGKVTTLDARTGAVKSTADLGQPLRACVVQVDRPLPPGEPGEALPFAKQLADAVAIEDPQLVVAQRLLLRELVAIEDETATRTLVDLASDPRTSPDLVPEARAALAARTTGAGIMMAALARHYDYLHDVLRAPPVGPLAQALARMKATSAAPSLASHLFDPADTDDDVRQVGAALAALAGPGELPALRQFFAMYRARAASDDVAAAAASVGEALARLGDVEVVRGAAADPQTVPYVKERLEALIAAQPAAPAVPPPPPPKKK